MAVTVTVAAAEGIDAAVGASSVPRMLRDCNILATGLAAATAAAASAATGALAAEDATGASIVLRAGRFTPAAATGGDPALLIFAARSLSPLAVGTGDDAGNNLADTLFLITTVKGAAVDGAGDVMGGEFSLQPTASTIMSLIFFLKILSRFGENMPEVSTSLHAGLAATRIAPLLPRLDWRFSIAI